MWRCDIRPDLCGTPPGWAFTRAESERVSLSLQVRRQGTDPSKEPSVEGSSGCAVGSPPGPLMEADKEVVGGLCDGKIGALMRILSEFFVSDIF